MFGVAVAQRPRRPKPRKFSANTDTESGGTAAFSARDQRLLDHFVPPRPLFGFRFAYKLRSAQTCVSGSLRIELRQRICCYLSGVSSTSTRISRHLNARPAEVYRALVDARAVSTWMVPAGMTSRVHAFDAREGGTFRISLTYDAPTATGKTSAQTDTFHGRFVKLVPDSEVVEVIEFETADPAMRGEMTVRYLLNEAEGGGTDLRAVHEGVPPGVSAADNETGWRMSLDKLAALVEAK
jgi:uncharacterized protein YndB with AHSA1/START domain